MLNTAKVAPLPMREVPAPILIPDKETALSLNRGSIICLCDAPRGQVPKVLLQFRVSRLNLHQSPFGNPSVRWTLLDSAGRFFEGGRQEIAIYKDVVLARPSDPVLTCESPWGLRAVFRFRLPHRYRMHHLAYLKRNYPRIGNLPRF